MIKLAIGEKLLIKQTSVVPTSPWRYRIVELAASTTIVQSASLTSDYELVTLTSAVYGAYEGKTLILEILNDSLTAIEEDVFLVSGVYGKLAEAKYTVGLLGENMKFSSPADGDYQDGNEKHRDVTLYTSAAMVSELATYDWTQEFVANFTPDARYQIDKIRQRKD